jgi:aquaporin Z
MEKHLSRDAFAEAIGTFMLVLVGAGAGAVIPDSNPAKIAIVALAHGLILVGIIYTYGHLSGAHVNPAVTLGLLAGGYIKVTRAVYYWFAQLIGAVLAAAFIKLFIPVDAAGAVLASVGETKGSLTGAYLPNALALEFIMTFFLVSVVIQAAAHGKAGFVAGLGIGLLLAANILFAGTLTGASLNPARTFGPALVNSGLFTYGLPYMIAILLGGGAAGYIQSAFFPNSQEPTTGHDRPSKKR